jgi:hypothetical protein
MPTASRSWPAPSAPASWPTTPPAPWTWPPTRSPSGPGRRCRSSPTSASCSTPPPASRPPGSVSWRRWPRPAWHSAITSAPPRPSSRWPPLTGCGSARRPSSPWRCTGLVARRTRCGPSPMPDGRWPTPPGSIPARSCAGWRPTSSSRLPPSTGSHLRPRPPSPRRPPRPASSPWAHRSPATPPSRRPSRLSPRAPRVGSACSHRRAACVGRRHRGQARDPAGPGRSDRSGWGRGLRRRPAGRAAAGP